MREYKPRLMATLKSIKAMVELEDIFLAVAAVALVVGLWGYDWRLGLIVPSVGFIGNAIWQRRGTSKT